MATSSTSALDLDSELVVACAVTPANRPEEQATQQLQEDMARHELFPDELLIDRAYINSDLAGDVHASGGKVLCRAWGGLSPKPGHFGKRDFNVNVRDFTITCPAGQVAHFEPGTVVHFNADVCSPCALRPRCTQASRDRGRSVTMSHDERLQKKLRLRVHTRAGRAELRERVGVEHRLAHLANRQGPKARYIGTRRNLFDLRRLSAVQNLEVIARRMQDQALRP